MAWSIVDFGKYRGKGKTLPQIIFSDPDWFFWAVEKDVFRGALAREAAKINARARAIRIPNNKDRKLVAEYSIHSTTGKFVGVDILPETRPAHQGSTPTFRKDVIDLSVARRIKEYDKFGGKILLTLVKRILFGSSSTRMTKERCEAFFEDDANFDL